MSINKAILIGNLCAKPELRYLPSGQAVCDLRVATNENFTDKQGIKQERVEFHRVTVWSKTAENCAKFLDKGRQVYVEGRIQTRSYDDKETGAKKYVTEIIGQTVQFLGNRGTTSQHTPTDLLDTPAQPQDTLADDDQIPF